MTPRRFRDLPPSAQAIVARIYDELAGMGYSQAWANYVCSNIGDEQTAADILAMVEQWKAEDAAGRPVEPSTPRKQTGPDRT